MKSFCIKIFALLLTINAFGQPANDDPAGAVLLTINSKYFTTYSSGTTVAATRTNLGPNPVGIYDDVWYKFEVTGASNNNVSIAVQNVLFSPNIGNYLQMNLWNETLTTRYAGTADGFYNQFSLGNGTWYVQVWTDGNNSTERSNFDINVRSITGAIPPNDECSSAINLTSNVSNCSSPIIGHNIGATTSTPLPTYGNSKNDVWYKFTAVAERHYISLTNIKWAPGVRYPNIAGSATANINVELGQGGCGSYVALTNNGELTSLETPNLIIGNEYYIRITSVLTNTYTRYFDFELCLSHYLPPNNNNCSNAISVPINSNGFVEQKIDATTLGASSSSTPTITTCLGDANDDVWFKFIAPAERLAINMNTTEQLGSTSSNMSWVLYSGNCSGLTQKYCSDSETDTLPSLIPGNTYYIRAFTFSANAYVNFNIALLKIPANPSNLTCASATSLTTNYISGTTLNGSDASVIDCYNYGSPNKTIWYSFVATATSHLIEFSDIYKLTNNGIGLGYRVYSGSCASLTSIKCIISVIYSNDTISGLTIGQTYYVQVMENSYNGGPVMFKIKLSGTAAPANDEASGAITIIQNPTCSNTGGSFVNASQSSNPVDPSLTHDVWYKFVAATTTANITYENLGGSAGRVVLYNSTGTTIITDPGVTTTPSFSGLTIGNTYMLRVYSSTLVNIGQDYYFNICVYGVPSSTLADAATTSGCLSVDGPATATNSNRWLHLTHTGKLLASVFDNGGSNTMGVITAKYFLNTGAVRTDPGGLRFLDRNYQITPTNQPSFGTMVPVRVYFTKAEFDALVATNTGATSDVNFLNDLKISRFGSAGCSNTISSTAGESIHDVTAWGSVNSNIYFLQFSIPSFSSFYLKNTASGTTLPVQCSSFNYKTEGNKVYLQWQTEVEFNNDRFEIERSVDGINFEKISSLPSSSSKKYSYVDIMNVSAVYYYRLKQVDKDGKSSYICRTLKVSSNSKNLIFGIAYPNPVINELQVDIIKPISGKINIQILNIQGQVLYQLNKELTNSDHQIKINTSTLNSGNYILKLISNQGVTNQQFVK
jgi:hypothetical protein